MLKLSCLVETITAEMHRHQYAIPLSCDPRMRHRHHRLRCGLDFGCHFGHLGGNDIHTKQDQSARNPAFCLSTCATSPSTAQPDSSFCATSGHDTGQRLQPVGNPGLFCPARNVAFSASLGDPIDAPETAADACGLELEYSLLGPPSIMPRGELKRTAVMSVPRRRQHRSDVDARVQRVGRQADRAERQARQGF